jgi:hypothetical protein
MRAVDSATFIVVTDGGGQLSTRSHEFAADLVLSKQIDPASVVALLRNHEMRRAA